MHENNGKPEALLWIDFETTGVDRRKSRFHANGHRKHLTWENLDDDGREPWRLIAKDAITEMLASPEIGGTA